MASTYLFRFSEDHLVESHLRYRKQLWWRRPFYAMKGLIAIPLLALAILCVVNGWVLGAAIFGGIIGIMFLAWPVDAWVIRRRFRKSPFHNEEISYQLADSGVHVIGKQQDVRLAWSVFTKCRRFRDGLLLFQGPHLFTWLPDVAVASGSTVSETAELVRTYVKDYRDV
jgi:hypothetical protein